MRKIVSQVIKAIIPRKILTILFPSKFIWGPADRRFVRIKDNIAGKSFEVYMREDSMMERWLVSDGLYGNWEKESLKIWSELSKNAMTIIDIGANTGIFTMLAKNNNSKSTVVAIEPVEINFDVLSKNILQNRFRVHAENVALSDVEGVAKMFMLKDRLNYMTSVNDNLYASQPEIQGNADIIEIQVPIKPFSYINEKYNLGKIDLVKIDVEGHEINVLKAMLPYIRISKPVILIEIIGDHNADLLNTMFDAIGYRYISINETEKSIVVNKLWDNNHHNFLICHDDTIEFLRGKGLVA
jgi:FkbM family methyltransferase